MDQYQRTTITTIDTANDSSDDDYLTSPTFSSMGHSTDTEEGLSSGDEEVMGLASPLNGDEQAHEDTDYGYDLDSGANDQRSTDTESKEESYEDNKEEDRSRCEFMTTCNTGSRDYRKVVSHVFGRNKKCTTQLPDSCWIVYCRKHYQRTRYRTSKAQTQSYFQVQIDLILRQLTRMKAWGGVRSWTISLRKKEYDEIKKEDKDLVDLRNSGGTVNDAAVRQIQKCKERFLLAHVGPNKTFDQVERCITAVRQEVERLGGHELPGFELLPNIDQEQYPPAATKRAGERKRKKGEVEDASSGDEFEGNQNDTQHGRATSSGRSTRFHTPASRARTWSTQPSSIHRTPNPTAEEEKGRKARRLVQASQHHLRLEDDVEVLEAESSAAASARLQPGRSGQATQPRKKGIAYRIATPKTTEAVSTTNTNATPSPRPSPRPFPAFQPINATPKEVAYRPALPRTPPRTSTSSSDNAARPNHATGNPSRKVFMPRAPKKIRLDDDMDLAEN